MSGELHIHAGSAARRRSGKSLREWPAVALLHRGQIGTVVMTYPDGACEVEFADRDGRAYAILPCDRTS